MLDIDNVEEYASVLDPEEAENIGRKYYRGLIAADEESGETCGAAVFELKNQDDMSKRTESRLSFFWARSIDAGNCVFQRYDAIISDAKAGRTFLEISAESSEDTQSFYAEQGFSAREAESRDLVIRVQDLAALDIVKKKTKLPDHLMALGMLVQRAFRRGIMDCVFHTGRELLSDITELPAEWYEPEVSCCVRTDDRINGFLLVHKTAGGRLRIELITAYGPGSKKDLYYMIAYSARQALMLYPPETEIILPRRDSHATDLIRYFFPHHRGRDVLFCERTEGQK